MRTLSSLIFVGLLSVPTFGVASDVPAVAPASVSTQGTEPLLVGGLSTGVVVGLTVLAVGLVAIASDSSTSTTGTN